MLRVEGALDGPDQAAAAAAQQVRALGRCQGDTHPVAIGLLGEGRVLVRDGRVAEGMALLDEAMAHVPAHVQVAPDGSSAR